MRDNNDLFFAKEIGRKDLPQCLFGLMVAVIFLTEMSEDDPLQAFRVTAPQEGACLTIGNMTAAPPDSPLQERRIGPGFQHMNIVVGFDNQPIEPFNIFFQPGEGVADVQKIPRVPLSVTDNKEAGFRAVMGRGQRVNFEISDFHAVAGPKGPGSGNVSR